jgi:uncharacterized membrane protein
MLLNEAPPLILTLVFIVLLSYFNYKLYVNNYYTVFDLGLSYRTAYLFSTTFAPVSWPIPHALVSAKPYTKMFYMVVGLSLLLHNSPFTVLIDQTVVIGLGSYAIFKISCIKTGNYLGSLAIQLAYFLYPSTYGYMTQGGNYMVYMEGLILLSYMFYLQNRKLPFLITAILAATTNTWAVPILFLLYMIDLLHSKKLSIRRLVVTFNKGIQLYLTNFFRFVLLVFERDKRNTTVKPRPRANELSDIVHWTNINLRQFIVANYALVLFFFSGVGIFMFEVHMYSLTGLVSSSRIVSSSPTTSKSSLLSFYPFLNSKVSFINNSLSPLLYTSLMSPFVIPVLIYFAAITLFTNYFPYYYPLEQYPYQFVGLLFISTIDFLSKIKNPMVFRKIVALILISSFISFSLYSPFGINYVTSGQLSSELQNSSLNTEINHAYNLIPIHSTVFIQNDMPQLMNRDKVYMNGYYDNQTVDYAVINPLPLNNIARAFGGFSSFWANHFALNKSYGVYESVQGVIVYKLHFNATPVYYVPAHYSSLIIASFQKNQTLPYDQYGGEYFSLSPGKFNVSFVMKANSSSNLPSNVLVRVMYSNNTVISYSTISRASFAFAGGNYFANITFNNTEFATFNFTLFSTGGEISQGTFILESIALNQIYY